MLKFSRLRRGIKGMINFFFGLAIVLKVFQSGLSVGQIVGIVVGSVSGLLLLVVGPPFTLKTSIFLAQKEERGRGTGDPGFVIEPFSDLHSPPPTTPLYDTQAFTPQNLKGQLSHGTMGQRYSQRTPTATVRAQCRVSSVLN
jgi:hypothetical protein